jgi:hypothetical protein
VNERNKFSSDICLYIYSILATNYFLKKIKIIDDANCNFCQKENEIIEHIFWGCENVQNLLGQVNSWFGDNVILYML